MKPIGLFEAYGIEIELMIVDRGSLDVSPTADILLNDATAAQKTDRNGCTSIDAHSQAAKSIEVCQAEEKAFLGGVDSTPMEQTSDFEDGPITWSNELVSHVIEFKSTAPEPSLDGLEQKFYASQQRASHLLARRGRRLMPTGMHPWMNPLTETVIWPHDNNEIYSLYNTIFDCRGHGWSNLQSVHINLPFKTEDEFKRLHSAIRLLLPLIPALTASTPFADGKLSGTKDTRLKYYETNQKRLPIIAGDVVPVSISSFNDYRAKISDPIQEAVRPFDTEGLLKGDWLNSRGAIARIDRGTIEIRLVDTQECAHADLTVVQLIVAVLKSFCENETLLATADQLDTKSLYAIWTSCVERAESAVINDEAFLETLFGSSAKGDRTSPTAKDVWRSLYELRVRPILGESVANNSLVEAIDALLSRPSLATRIEIAFTQLKSETLQSNLSRPESDDRLVLARIYEALCNCLDKNKVFDPARLVTNETDADSATIGRFAVAKPPAELHSFGHGH